MEATKELTVARTLIADDQPDVLAALHLLLKGEGYQTELVSSPGAVVESLQAGHYDLLLMDLNYARDTTSGREGLDLLTRVQAIDQTLPVVVMTAWSSVALAVEAMRRGVRDFVQKPWDNAQLLSTVRTQVERARCDRRRLKQDELEREDARDIVQRLLPKELPQIPGYEISAAWEPARLVGGDYYDVQELGSGRVGFCVADVIGNGIPAALLMANLQAAIKAAAGPLQPRELCTRINRQVFGNIAAGKFITLFYGQLDLAGRNFIYTNAGHNAPILLGRDGLHRHLEQGGAALGIFPEWSFEQGSVRFSPGDRLVLYTDGVTEARNALSDEFGEPRLLELLKKHRALGARALRDKILEAVTDFSGGEYQDDVTLIVTAVE